MKKRILSLFLAFVMTVGLLPASAMAAEGDPVIIETGHRASFPADMYLSQIELKDVCGEVETIKITEIANIYQQLIENHAKSVKSGNYLNAEDALHNLQLCEASHKSAQNNGEIITIP